MASFSIRLTNHIVKHFNVTFYEASFIVEDEWEYIEDKYLNEVTTIESLAQELVNIYMVA